MVSLLTSTLIILRVTPMSIKSQIIIDDKFVDFNNNHLKSHINHDVLLINSVICEVTSVCRRGSL